MNKKYLKCPACASLVRKGDKECSVCGYSFERSVNERSPVGNGEIECPHCHAKIESFSVYCKICGKAVKSKESIRRR